MIRSRRHRPLLVALLAGLLLFAQLAAAAYACPGLALPTAAVEDCGGHDHGTMDPDQPQLCRASCDPGDLAPQTGGGPDLAAVALALPVLLWLLPDAMPEPGLALPAYAPAHGPPRGGPPLYLSLLVLRN
mgnify:FL=1